MADTPMDPSQLSAVDQAAQNANNSLSKLGELSNTAKDALSGLGSISNNAKTIIDGLANKINQFNTSIMNTGKLTTQQNEQFALLSTAVIGAKASFEGLSNIDVKGLTTFGSQVDEIIATFQSGAAGDAIRFTKDMSAYLLKSGASAKQVAEFASQGVAALSNFAKNFLTSADNAMKLQNAFIQLSAKTGNLDTVFKQAGPNLENINALLEEQSTMILNAAKATGVAPEAIQKYYSELGTIPKALESVVHGSGGATDNISMLTATIKLATGTGRSYSDIISDLSVAFKDYGLVGEPALLFTARFSEISNKFGIELDDVRKGLIGSANAFTSFANAGKDAGMMAEGLASIMNKYVGSLMDVGMSSHNAVSAVNMMSGAIANLKIEQKAFLSAQTGGPGGLMGGFQIEKMLKEGKVEEVFEKVRQSMQKQFGKIVTVDEASQSEGAAQQLTKQKMLLQQGPLGSFVKSDQDAYRILEAFRNKEDGKGGALTNTGGLGTDTLQKSIDMGTSIEEKSYSELTVIRNTLEEIRSNAMLTNYTLLQKGITASAGVEQPGAPSKYKESLKTNMANSALKSGNDASEYGAAMGPEGLPITNKAGAAGATAIKDIKNILDTLPESLKSTAAAVMGVASSKKELDDMAFDETSSVEYSPSSKKLLTAPKGIPSKNTNENVVNANNATNEVGEMKVNVEVTGYCLNCKNTMEGGSNAKLVNAGKTTP